MCWACRIGAETPAVLPDLPQPTQFRPNYMQSEVRAAHDPHAGGWWREPRSLSKPHGHNTRMQSQHPSSVVNLRRDHVAANFARLGHDLHTPAMTPNSKTHFGACQMLSGTLFLYYIISCYIIIYHIICMCVLVVGCLPCVIISLLPARNCCFTPTFYVCAT